MNEPLDNGLRRIQARKARASIARRVTDYYNSLLSGLDTDADAFFDRVMSIHAQRQTAAPAGAGQTPDRM